MGNNSKNNLFNYFKRNDLISIELEEAKISYSNLYKSACNLSEYLSTQIKKDDYVVICIEDKVLFIKTVIALWLIGAVPVPINTRMLDSEIASLLDNNKFKFFISDDREIDIRISSAAQIIVADNEKFVNSDNETTEIPGVENEAVVIFTSGSTGKPKGVVHTFSSLTGSIENANSILNQEEEKDGWLASLPFYHIGGFQILCRSLYYGSKIIIPKSFQTEDLVKSISVSNPTHLSLVSPQLERLIEKNIVPGNSLKVSLVGGGFIDDDLMIKSEAMGWKPYRVYGSSETASLITALTSKEIKLKPASVGRPLPGVQIKISVDSEILINSKSNFKCYLEDENETLNKLADGFYHSGDLGFIDNEGYLFIESRRNDLIVTGGENVNPIEVEKVFMTINGIKEACVFAQPNKTWGQIVACALVVDSVLVDEKVIKESLKQMLAGYKIPKRFYFTDHLPKTSLGKFEREKIKNIFK